MDDLLQQLSEQVCYTELVFQRVNKKLKIEMSEAEVKVLVQEILADATTSVERRGKNYYITNAARNVRLTINHFNCRLITADRVVI